MDHDKAGAYRSADHARSLAELEAALADAAARIRQLESQLSLLRSRRNRRIRQGVVPAGGVGAVIGACSGGAAWFFLGNPFFLLLATVGGFLAGVIGHIIWRSPDDEGGGASPFTTVPPA